MKFVRADSFKKDYQELPAHIQKLFDKKIRIFADNMQHPSLRVKKLRGLKNRLEGGINMFYRFTFEVHAEHYLFRRIGPQDTVLKNP